MELGHWFRVFKETNTPVLYVFDLSGRASHAQVAAITAPIMTSGLYLASSIFFLSKFFVSFFNYVDSPA